MRYDRAHDHRGATETVVGPGSQPPARVPRNILVEPLKTPPMAPIKDGTARPGLDQEEDE